MKSCRILLLCCVVWWGARASAQEFANPLDGTLVHCGTDNVVVFEGTESKDGHFAAGWTLRPKADKPPVNWSDYHRKDLAAFLARFVPAGDIEFPTTGDYTLVNGLLNLQTKTFTPLPSKAPFYPEEPNCDLRVAWSDGRKGTRDAAVSNVVGSNHSENSVELWLVEFSAGKPRTTDLKPDADKAVGAYMAKRDPKDAAKYQWSYDFTEFEAGGKPTPAVFKGDTLTVHFEAQIPEQDDTDSGRVSFALPTGKVTGTTSEKQAK